MRVTIIREDSAAIVNGERYAIDCSDLPADVHAVQWNDTDRGEVEYSVTRCTHCGARSKKGNGLFPDFAPYMIYMDRWNAAKQKADAEKAAAEAVERAKANDAGQQD